MTQPWFRVYEEILDDPKVQKLPPDLFKAWINVLALACRFNGKIPNVSDCAFALRMTESDVLAVLERLLDALLIDKVAGGPDGYHYAPHSWKKRQYKSDTSTERVKRFREKVEALPKTPPETETETETEEGTKVPSATPLSEPLDATTVKAVITAWNNLASETGIAQVQHISENRRKALKPRLKEIGGLEGWYAMCDKIRASSFLTGQGEKPWYCTFDWVLKPANLAKIMEGNYDDRQNGSGVKKGTIARNFEAIDDAIDQLRRREDAERFARS